MSLRSAAPPDRMPNARAARFRRTLRWVPEFLTFRSNRVRARARLLGAAMLVGVVAGLGAVLFVIASRIVTWAALERFAGYRPKATPGEPTFHWLPPGVSELIPAYLVIAPALGGLVSGILVFTFAPEAEGHGTDAAIEAYHRGAPIRPRVPLIKMIASAITIGSGGSGGREGPSRRSAPASAPFSRASFG